jgi:arginine-tRNA-protein transferase
MRVDGEPRLAPPVECPYLPDRSFVQRYFFGDQTDAGEMSALLTTGWRRFGTFFFRPECPGCRACVPVRLALPLALTDSQKRVWRKNEDIEFSVAALEPKPEYYELYREHSLSRFGKQTDPEEFRTAFFEQAAPAFVTEYRFEGRLAGLGFCDRGDDALSSVYFVFGDEFASRSLGVYSVLRECVLAQEMGLKWYYLGYWVQGNATMAYKGKFFPRRLMDWDSGTWNEG